ncbi:ABC transporter substrate-binding protein [Euzebya rosea]|uniref:ABC transporter substrate-binding protein n=1 Tax=Euzebya rosea TaxID=2052804 RepID=UPI00196A5661|nr:sugar ABC transporter substrate-binding protein [Euzebya rosea]
MVTSTTTRLGQRLLTLLLLLAMVALAACSSSDSDAAGDDTGSADSAETADDAADDTADDAADESADEGADSDEAAGASGDAVELTYFTFSAAPDHLEDLDRIIAGFEEENPGVTIEVQTAAYDDYFTQLQTRVAGGSAPDTFELNYENFVTYAEAGTLMDLDATVGDAVDPSVFYPRAYEVFAHDGVQYGLPATFSNVVLFYNADLFDAAGMDYPTADWTWEDERAAAEALTDADAGVWGTFQPVSFFEYFKVLAQNGGEFFTADGSDVAFDSPEGVEAAEWLLSKVGTIMPTEADMGGQDDAAMFKSGQLAMWHNGIWQFAAMADADFTWDVVVEPGNTTDASHFFANAVVASTDTEHPDEAAAWLQYIASSDTAVQTRLESDWELPAVADESLFEPWLEVTPPANRAAVFESLDAVVVPPVIAQQAQLQDAVDAALEQARLGQIDAQAAVDQAAADIRGLLGS